jgi:hypothetical protein
MSQPYAWMTNLLGTGSQSPVRMTPPLPSTPAAPLATQIVTANVPVTVFAAGSIVNVADILNPTSQTEPLYVDIVAPAAVGAPTSIPLQPGQAYRISAPVSTAVTAVAATAGHSFVAVTY